MKIDEFIEEYCQDIKERFKESKSLVEELGLPYDTTITDDTGEEIPVVYAGKTAIPVMDIITSKAEDFAVMYPDFECRELYDNYMSSLEFEDGPDAVQHIRKLIQKEQDRVQAFTEDNSLSEML